MKVTKALIFCTLLFFRYPLLAQKKNEIAVESRFLQLKDALNQGMVYGGPHIGFRYRRNIAFETWELRYEPRMAVGVLFNRGMIAANFQVSPIDFSGLVPVFRSEKAAVRAGLHFAANYCYQLYPNQMGAHLFWSSEIGFSPCAEYDYRWKNRKITLFLQNSVAGFVSHTQEIPPYFYSLTLADFVVQPHCTMQFGSFNTYNHTNLTVSFTPNVSTHHSFALGAEYFNIYAGKRFQSLTYSVQWKKSF
ncbi:MAG: hypothetical protein LBU90_08990 [Bacteroidales bacterium]|jgi:hypothetical protein|nr:hypothetical protein [Bacteroidales bacterium]